MFNALKKILVSLFLVQVCCFAFAVSLPELEVSLLTCEPGTAIYEHYGHTALRVRHKGDSLNRPIDLVFNYGCFDFSEPNFALRFALGHTDYLLGVLDYKYFEQEYVAQHRRVWQQTLNLTDEEARRLFDSLVRNAMPQNRVYRYNFLYNNCTTKCRDMIEACALSGVDWHLPAVDKTFRGIMHEYNEEYPLASMSIDLCLGRAVDEPISARECMFAPMYMMEYLNGATVGGRRLTNGAFIIIDGNDSSETSRSVMFNVVLVLVGVISLLRVLSLVGGSRGQSSGSFINRAKVMEPLTVYFDWFVLALVGVVGLIISFLFFFSEHPSVDSNILVLVFNPLPLFAFALYRQKKMQLYVLYLILCLFLCCACAASLEVQQVPRILVLSVFVFGISVVGRILSYYAHEKS